MPPVSAALVDTPRRIRRHIRVAGQVQGVGFRPYVFRLAQALELSGWVRNDGQGVEIEVEGDAAAVEGFVARLPREAPALSRISAVETHERPPRGAQPGFTIEHSGGGPMRAAATPDFGTCGDCLRELFDPADRRYRYPFINCTQCGPRYSIIRGLPYDRALTSMAGFRQCPACSAEYAAPTHRRFHAEPNACARCGPRLSLADASGQRIEVVDVIAEALARLRRGEILALKGLGGFHLTCDARNADAVARLRRRKQREEKPFALMVANTAGARKIATLGEAERALLESPQRPIVLLRKRPESNTQLQGVAPGLAWLGVMLPYAPLHYLLFHEAVGRPAGLGWLAQLQPLCLVMTSANPGGEPLVIDDAEAARRLHGIADAFVMHDREIVTRCDDSVVRVAAELQFIRRARGFTPQAIELAHAGPPVLAFGAYLKNTICLTRGDQAFVSQHIGDLDNAPTCNALEETLARLIDLLQVEPALVAHDLHPDFFSTRFAAAFARRRGIPAIAVQHHHAHVAAVMAEHRLEGEVLGLALDGVGMGNDGGIWGGELLRAASGACVRIGQLRELALPGGDRAAREPWRMGASALHALGRGDAIVRRFSAQPGASVVARMLEHGVHSPPSSSCGRWFDAAAGLAGVRTVAAFEGQAAMLFEGLADRFGPVPVFEEGFVVGADGVLDLLPLLERVAVEPDQGAAAALFHATLAAALAAWVEWGAAATGLRRVALGGGCFLNHILSAALRTRLDARGRLQFGPQFSLFFYSYSYPPSPAPTPVTTKTPCRGTASSTPNLRRIVLSATAAKIRRRTSISRVTRTR